MNKICANVILLNSFSYKSQFFEGITFSILIFFVIVMIHYGTLWSYLEAGGLSNSDFLKAWKLKKGDIFNQPPSGHWILLSHRRFLKKRFLKHEYLNVYVLRVYLLCAIIAGIDLIPGSSDENAVTTAVKCHYMA